MSGTIAGTQLTDLTEITSPSYDDIVYGVHNPNSLPISGKVTIQNLVLASFNDKGNIPVGTGASAGTMLPSGSDGQKLVPSASEGCGLKWINDTFTLSYIISYPTSATLYPAVECGYAGSVSSVRMYSGTVMGNVTIDLYKMTYAQLANAPGTTYSMIGTATKPSFSGTNCYEGTTLTGWTSLTFEKGDWLIPYVSSAGTITSLTVAIGGVKTAVS